MEVRNQVILGLSFYQNDKMVFPVSMDDCGVELFLPMILPNMNECLIENLVFALCLSFLSLSLAFDENLYTVSTDFKFI